MTYNNQVWLFTLFICFIATHAIPNRFRQIATVKHLEKTKTTVDFDQIIKDLTAIKVEKEQKAWTVFCGANKVAGGCKKTCALDKFPGVRLAAAVNADQESNEVIVTEIANLGKLKQYITVIPFSKLFQVPCKANEATKCNAYLMSDLSATGVSNDGELMQKPIVVRKKKRWCSR